MSPSISVVIPAYRAEATLAECLHGIARSTVRPVETRVVGDDGSTDRTASVAGRAENVRVIAVADGPRGPAHARNTGARAAAGDILLFLDADVVVHPDAIGRISACFTSNPDVSAVFGSYDDRPAAPSRVSRYRNLLHYYVHQHSRRDASTFWAGCGAVRRLAFDQVGGFDENYTRPSIEDIELGVRLAARGARILLMPDVQVTHLKAWSLADILRTDIRSRAWPWAILMLSRGEVPDDLNTSTSSRLSALLAWVLVAAAFAAVSIPAGRWTAALAAVGLVVLNRHLYACFRRNGGTPLLLVGVVLHTLYLLSSSATFAAAMIYTRVVGRRRREAPVA
ncbi:MAG TPA: glycosyltransferase [Vicinamibacterales bacterium]|nr:glycosyltransferase [Vicinamibacterales bacterium]